MHKRKFIKTTTIVVVGSALVPAIACKADLKETKNNIKSDVKNKAGNAAFELPKLGFDFNALEPNIDAQTMEIHHGKHHAGYVRKFNAALEDSSFAGKDLLSILSGISIDDLELRNNGGGHFNHSLFWSILSPSGGGEPSGDLADAINASFGSFDNFKDEFSAAAKTRFGSGWAWLCQDKDGKLFVSSTPNQDNPLMTNIVDKTGTPLLGLDVWEHAYYLNYQNRRADYVSNFFNIINWNTVAEKLG